MLRIIFMGTAELACASLKALTEQPDWQVVAVVTQPDKPKGRDLKLQPSPVKAVALERGLHIFQPIKAREETFISQLRELQPDLIVVAAYGQILPPSILDLPKYKCLNVHTSLLPKYRGAAPIQWAILDGEPETGVTIMKMDVGLDTGDIVAMERTPILPTDNAETLHDRLAEIGAKLLVETIPLYISEKSLPQKQPAEGSSYARKITKEDGLLDWTQPARVLWNRIRAFTPWPGAFTFYESGNQKRLLKIWQAEVVEKMEIQLPPELIQIQHLYLGPGKGSSVVMQHVPTGLRVGCDIPADSTAGFPRDQLIAQLSEKVTEHPDFQIQPGQIIQADKQGIFVGCGQQALRILVLQKEGGRRLTAAEFLTGNPLKPGERLANVNEK